MQPYDDVTKWAPDGSQAGLYLLNPKRVSFFDAKIRQILKPPFRTLDAGCGGGLVSNTLGEHSDYIIEGASDHLPIHPNTLPSVHALPLA